MGPPGPVRTCIGCRKRAAKSELVRVTAGSDADGRPAAVPDPAATRRGRGAHLHPTTACYDLAVRRRAFASALRAGAGLDSAPVASYLASLSTTDSTTDQPSEEELEQ
jgi:predicted RNA-binding protein YlxR (DUF448 family)